MAKEEKKFCAEIEIMFEHMSWEMLRAENELIYIKEYL
jgi:hypothetical protein